MCVCVAVLFRLASLSPSFFIGMADIFPFVSSWNGYLKSEWYQEKMAFAATPV